MYGDFLYVFLVILFIKYINIYILVTKIHFPDYLPYPGY